jgi:hypothetical protein
MSIRIKKSVGILLFAAIILGLTYPLHQADAQLDWLFAPLEELARLATLTGLAVGVSWLILLLSQGVLGWAASADFMTMSITNNDFVATGWGITRDFVNMFFILILVAIGIATALRIGQYEIKKSIPRLILVALLINFTPVICGVIIDAANIIMHFFLSAGAEGFAQTLNLSSVSGSAIIEGFRSAWYHPMELFNGTLLFRALAIIAFNVIASFILLVISILLLTRYVALWILVILSPLAFFAFILPATKKIWNIWWNQFVQWSFIGVGVGFFLYLTQLLLQNTKIFKVPAASGTGLGPTLVGIMVQFVPLIFLAAGYFVITKSSAMGANMVIGLAERGGKMALGKGKLATMGRLRESASIAAEPYKQRVSEWANRVAKEEPATWGRGSTVQQIVGQRVRRQVAKGVLRRTVAPDAAQIGKLTEKYDGMTAEQRTLELNTARTNNERLAVILSKAKNQDKLTDQETEQAMELALRTNNRGIVKKALQMNPKTAQKMWQNQWDEFHGLELEEQAAIRAGNTDLANARRQQRERVQDKMDTLGMRLTPEDFAKYNKFKGKEFEAKLMDAMKEKDIPNMSENYIRGDGAQELIHEFWRGSQISAAAKTFEKAFVESFNKETNVKIKDPTDPTGIREILKYQDYHAKHPQAYRYLRGNAGQELGFVVPPGPPSPPQPTPGPTIHTPPSRAHVKFSSKPPTP